MVWLGAGHKHVSKNKKLGIAFSGTITAVTMFAAVFLMSGAVFVGDVYAAPSAYCSLTGGGMDSHRVNVRNGAYVSDIGTTTLTVFCDDSEGFAIYANGFTDEEEGKNVLVNNALVNNNTIATGIATSGGISNWAMKITKVSDSGDASAGNAFTIDSAPNTLGGADASFANYHAVPAVFTKVAHKNAATDMGMTTGGATLETTYAVYVDQNQAAGVYVGKVKYVLVHPATLESLESRPYTIVYDGNNATAGTMSGVMTSLDTLETKASLMAPNFKRANYGFAGWSVDRNATVNGTSKIYGPNERIVGTEFAFDDFDREITLYAVWVPTSGEMQTYSCSDLSSGQVVALTDNRDGNIYTVGKMQDEKCWMMENLRLDDTAILDGKNTNNPKSGFVSLAASSDVWCGSPNSGCFDQSMLNTNNVNIGGSNTSGTTLVATPGIWDGSNYDQAQINASRNDYSQWYGYGNYYNWYSSTAGYGTYSASWNMAGDICPLGWQLPAGPLDTDGDLYDLNEAMIAAEISPGDGDEETASNRWRSYPNNFVYAGRWLGNFAENRGAYGYYWTRAANGGYTASSLRFANLYVGLGGGSMYKSNGFTLRCLSW